ncbi:MAG: hypothetical protein HC822_03795 [Oscillochloris sp.]|nr:hypothetical protein [Oscillochloris sp.]
MNDPRFEYFNTSVDKAANRALVEAVSGAVIAIVRPRESVATPYVIGPLLERAAQGETVRAGSDADFGLGGGKLMAYIVVPLVTQLVSGAFMSAGVAGVGGLETLPASLPQVTADEVLQQAQRSDLKLGRKEAAKVAVQINQLFVLTLQRSLPDPDTPEPTNRSRCAPYHCRRLRRIFTNHFSREEIAQLCFDCELPHEDIMITEHSASVRRLIEYMLRRGRLMELVELAREDRPEIDWEAARE